MSKSVKKRVFWVFFDLAFLGQTYRSAVLEIVKKWVHKVVHFYT